LRENSTYILNSRPASDEPGINCNTDTADELFDVTRKPKCLTVLFNSVKLTMLNKAAFIHQEKKVPKAPRNSNEILIVKEKILDVALDILFEEGFHFLSMRKIAVKMKMTAANLYNYFSNKDEIYLAIQTRGFALLHKQFEEINQSKKNPLDKIQQMVCAYVKFGIHFPDQYEIMFTRNTPKYSDYIGTTLEPAATIEKQTALRVAEVATEAFLELAENNPLIHIQDAGYRTIQMWTALHGIVSLINSRVLQEVDPDTNTMIEKLTEELLLPFMDTGGKKIKNKRIGGAGKRPVRQNKRVSG
jgi:AcrR family transcriptional regulator